MPAPKVTVYTKDACPFCVRAKRLLARKGVPFEEISVEGRDDLREWLVETSGQLTVPQIFAGARSLGGYTDIEALDAEGKLDPVLRGGSDLAPTD
jgi:glutaredoxin 3